MICEFDSRCAYFVVYNKSLVFAKIDLSPRTPLPTIYSSLLKVQLNAVPLSSTDPETAGTLYLLLCGLTVSLQDNVIAH
jgi:hypothetical protein